MRDHATTAMRNISISIHCKGRGVQMFELTRASSALFIKGNLPETVKFIPQVLAWAGLIFKYQLRLIP